MLHDGTDRWGFWLLNGSLNNPNGGGVFYSSDFNSDYREIELLYTPVTPGIKSSGDTLQIFVDQVLAVTQDRDDALDLGVGPNMVFGGNSSAGTGEARWNHIEFVEGAILGFAEEVPVPEPGTGLLLLMGCAVVVKRRRSAKVSCSARN